MVSLTLTPPAPSTSPTQKLRDLIDLIAAGVSTPEDLHNELLRLESVLEIPLTEVSRFNGLDEAGIRICEAEDVEEELRTAWTAGQSPEALAAWEAQRAYVLHLHTEQNETAGA